MTYRSVILADSPVAYWRLGESSGLTAATEVGSLSGTYTGSPTLRAPGLLMDDTDTAVAFNGSSQYVQSNDTGLPSGNAAWSLEGWVKTSASAAAAGVIGYGTQSGTGDVNLALNFGALFFFSHSGTNSFGGAFADGAKHHLVLTYNGTTMFGYADGVQVGSSYAPAARNIVLGNGAEIGVWSNFFSGTIDEVAIYPTALTVAQVRSHYNAASKYAAAVISDAPVSYWRLNDSGATAVDDTGGHDGTYINSPTHGTPGALTGDPAVATSFASASSQYVSVPFTAALDPGAGAVSYECWVKLATTGADMYFMERGLTTGGLSINAAGTIYWLSTGSALGAHSSINITDTLWHHYVATHDASHNWKVYIDGVDRTMVDGTPTPGTGVTSAFVFARELSQAPADYLNGAMDEVAVYNVALTAAQVRRHYNAARSRYADIVTADAPVAYWRLGESSGTVAADSAGTNAGTYVGAPTLGVAAALTGDVDGAVTFGTGKFVTVSSSLALPSPAFSLEVWVNTRGTLTSDNGLLGRNSYVPDAGAFLYLYGTDDVKFYLDTVSLDAFNIPGLATDSWHHIVGTYDGASARLYVDGALYAGPTVIAAPSVPGNGFRMGQYGGSNGSDYPGSLDEAAVYSKALSPMQVAAHYAAGRGATALLLLGGL